MRILLAGKFVPTGSRPIGGLQSWIKTADSELTRRGHQVRQWRPGMELNGTFDLGIIANLKYTRPVLNFCRRSILVSHGIIPAEKPEAGCDVTAFVSEGVRDHWQMDGPVIRQPIDLDFWEPSDGPRTHLIRYSYRTAPIHGERVAEALGLEWCHVYGMTHENARICLQGAACVLATGRGALEAMACGCPTIVYDHRKAYQGPLMNLDMNANIQNSYSGRGGREPTEAEVIEACQREIERGSPRPWVEDHHDARRVVDRLIDLM